MDENKMFEFMTKLYSEMQEGFKVLKTEVESVKEALNENIQRLDTIENEIKKLGVMIDGKLIPTSGALMDGYKDITEHITIIDDKIDRLQIDVNSITMKAASYNESDSRIIGIS